MISRVGIDQSLARAFPLDAWPFEEASTPSEEEAMFQIEVYRRSRLIGRPEWRWRARARNGEVVANSTEGYINRSDLNDELEELRAGFATAAIVTVDQ